MNSELIYFTLFVLSLSANIGATALFRGASRTMYKILELVSAIGILVFIAFCVCHFFIMEWWKALLIAVLALLILPLIGMKLGKIPFSCLVTPILTIAFGVIYYCTAIKGVLF